MYSYKKNYFEWNAFLLKSPLWFPQKYLAVQQFSTFTIIRKNVSPNQRIRMIMWHWEMAVNSAMKTNLVDAEVNTDTKKISINHFSAHQEQGSKDRDVVNSHSITFHAHSSMWPDLCRTVMRAVMLAAVFLFPTLCPPTYLHTPVSPSPHT